MTTLDLRDREIVYLDDLCAAHNEIDFAPCEALITVEQRDHIYGLLQVQAPMLDVPESFERFRWNAMTLRCEA